MLISQKKVYERIKGRKVFTLKWSCHATFQQELPGNPDQFKCGRQKEGDDSVVPQMGEGDDSVVPKWEGQKAFSGRRFRFLNCYFKGRQI